MVTNDFRDMYIPICQLYEQLLRTVEEDDVRKLMFGLGFSMGRMASDGVSTIQTTTAKHDLESSITSSLTSFGFDAAVSDISDIGDTDQRGKSFENELHITLLKSPEASVYLASPVSTYSTACWFACGFASGYSCSHDGDEGYVFVEQRCSCGGGNKCHLLGRRRSSWTEAPAPEAISWIDELLHSSTPVQDKARENKFKLDALTHAENVLNNRKSNQPEALREAVNILSKGFVCTTAIEEMGVLTYTCVHDHDKQSESNPIFNLGGLALKASRSFSQASSYYLNKKTGFFLDDNVSGHAVHRLVTPIVSQHRTIGYFMMLRVDYPFLQTDVALAGRAAEAISHVIQELRHIQLLDGKLKSSFIDNIVTGSSDSSNPALNYERELGFSFEKGGRALVVDITDPEGQFPPTSRTFDTDLWIQVIVGKVREQLPTPPESVAVYRNKQIVILLKTHPDDSIEKIRMISEHIYAALATSYPKLFFTIGIGSIFSSIDGCKQSFESAIKAIDTLKKTNTNEHICSIDQFDARTLLYGSYDKEALKEFASIHLGSIVKYDKEFESELLYTLEVYISNRGNSHKTAQDLALSSSGLKYRLKTIERLTGLSVRDTSNFYDLVTAIDIVKFIGIDNLRF